ncbi:phage tail tape measure protein [Brevibacillus borstelensis]|uniref:phage tail tape measure protein n=1 Tax=Brevibacillus borstelensis TaxID=45462 RepID=UPI00287FBDF7|nr:phage tail tape measure protein [Brevibacillus borstelensis]WNF07480.1 phage tail tape measure protein [Brevibacillus borstelensis]
MAMDLTARLRLIDNMTAPLRRVTESLKRTESSVGKAANAASTYERATSKASKSVSSLTGDNNRMGRSFGSLPGVIGRVTGLLGGLAVGAAGVGIAFDAFKTAADFESSMSRVGALSGATRAEMALLTQSAKDLGATTVFSASEAAEGMSFLAMAGYRTNEIIAAMPGLLDAAAAGQTELGETADIVSNILSGFGIEASKTGHVADVLTKAFTSSNTDLRKLGYTMKYVAPVAKSLSFSLEETAAAAGLLGNAGIQGEMAGTSLRMGLLRLANPPKEAAKALKKLNVEVTKGGKMKDLATIIEDMSKGLSKLSEADRASFVAEIVGTEAASSFLTLIDAGPEKLRAFTRELENSTGAAKTIAARQLDNFNGSVKLLNSALESLKINAVGPLLPTFQKITMLLIAALTPLMPKIEEVALAAADAAERFTKWLGTREAKEWGDTLSNILSTVGPMIVGATSALVAMKVAQIALNIAMMANPLGLIVAGIGALIGAGYLLYKNWDTIKQAASDLWVTLRNAFARGVNWVIGHLNKMIDAMNKVLQHVGITIPQIPEVALDYSVQQREMEEFRQKRNLDIDGSHYNGLDYVPYDGYTARLHKGERVLTSAENEQYTNGGGGGVTIAKLADQIIVREEADIDRLALSLAREIRAVGGLQV